MTKPASSTHPWPPIIQDLLCLHEMFRRMGYEAKDLYVAEPKGGEIQFVLKEGKKTFTIDVGKVENTKKMLSTWAKAAAWWNEGSTERERSSIFWASEFRAHAVDIAAAMMVKGFVAPKVALSK